jgi:3-oxoacyl-[acyl-carrier-protein] synthase II
MMRVVVTGMGCVSSLGLDAETTWSRALAGECGIQPLRNLSMPDEAVQIAAEIDLPADPGVRLPNLCERPALRALEECLAHSGLDLERGDPRRRGVFQGASTSDNPAAERFLAERMAGRRGRPTELLRNTPAALTDRLAQRFLAMGPRSTVMNACSSSLLALGQAWERVACGDLDLALAGGAEGLCRTTFAGFSSLKAMDPRPCRPFSRDRAGMNLGEGSGQFLLESLEHARARGASILGEVLGYGASMDAYHATAPHPDGQGAARAMTMALNTARLHPDDIDLVSAHGTATPANDGAECLAIRHALGESARSVSVNSCKSQFGHTLAAAGAMSAAMALLALRDQVVSPTLRLEETDPFCDLDCTPLVPRERRLRAALVNACAFGGNNVSLALLAWEGR